VTWEVKANRDPSVRITAQKIRAAGEALILRNDTHLDQLTDKLREPRVQRVIEPMLLGVDSSASDADFQYVLDLGLIRLQDKTLLPANAIYAEVLPRVLSSVAQRNLSDERIQIKCLFPFCCLIGGGDFASRLHELLDRLVWEFLKRRRQFR